MHILIADDHDFVCRSLREIMASTLVALGLSAGCPILATSLLQGLDSTNPIRRAFLIPAP